MGNPVVVVGGGIAGLAAAISLSHAGARVLLLETAAEVAEVGAGLAITTNGLTAARYLGIDTPLRERGRPGRMDGYTDRDGVPLLRLPPTGLARFVGIHRQVLLELLLQRALDSGVEVRTSARVTSVGAGEAAGAPAVVHYGCNGGEYSQPADLVIGADGLHSVVRRSFWPQAAVVYSGKTCWRALVRFSDPPESFTPRLGPHAEFGALGISAHSIYWYGYVRAPEGARLMDEKGSAAKYFADWPGRVAELVEQTAPQALLRHDVYRLHPLPPRLHTGRVVVIGDAAHAMVPTMGQGANTALEDGASVGRLLGSATADGRPLTDALHRYQHQRWRRTRDITRQSWQLDQFGADLHGSLDVRLRDEVLRRVPVKLALRQRADLLTWRCP